MTRLLLILAPAIPVLALFGAAQWELLQRQRHNERTPFLERMLRPPGYSLSVWSERLQERLIIFLLLAMLPLTFLPWLAKDFMAVWVVLSLVSAFGTVAVWRTVLELRNCLAGLRGEQAVAEKLHALLAEGYRVFHDFDTECRGNIDHIVVGEAGVFAIETKYRRKRSSRSEQADHEVWALPEGLQFPRWMDRKSPEQTRRNAEFLTQFLRRMVNETVPVEGVLVLPGWFVKRKARLDVAILSGNELENYFSKRPAQLSGEQVERIAKLLDNCCRTVAP